MKVIPQVLAGALSEGFGVLPMEEIARAGATTAQARALTQATIEALPEVNQGRLPPAPGGSRTPWTPAGGSASTNCCGTGEQRPTPPAAPTCSSPRLRPRSVNSAVRPGRPR
ncbi:hypothetical protein ADL06_19360 [Streptomyces sp. NRRL F-6491]|nr:hypothetical protein ADL06_19360 [Streptomyces sp. NRRL F-6491]KOX37050.1 hypothetical protein ADL08_30650 [Streptomyces sp. NRRL F-6492]